MTPLNFMVAAAKATIENLTPADVAGELARPDVAARRRPGAG